MAKRPRVGWRSAEQRRGRPVAALPDVPSEFDALLTSMGLTEAEAVSNAIVRFWIGKNRLIKYVPESILKALKYEVPQ